MGNDHKCFNECFCIPPYLLEVPLECGEGGGEAVARRDDGSEVDAGVVEEGLAPVDGARQGRGVVHGEAEVVSG